MENQKSQIKEKYLDLFNFNIGSSNLCISVKDKKVYLRTPDDSYVSELNIPAPDEVGYNPKQASYSTYDERDVKTFVYFKPLNQDSDNTVLEVGVTKEWEYWYYGSLDDDWHKNGSFQKNKLTVKKQGKEGNTFSHKLEEIAG